MMKTTGCGSLFPPLEGAIRPESDIGVFHFSLFFNSLLHPVAETVQRRKPVLCDRKKWMKMENINAFSYLILQSW